MTPALDPRIWLHGGGRLELGDRVAFGVGTAPIELHIAAGAVLTVGDDVCIDGGVSIEAAKDVRIGARARLGTFSKVMDNHFHSASGCRQERPPSAPVVIEEDVDIGPRAILLPGAQIGCGSRVAAGTVVTRRVPPASFVSGVPAVVRPLPASTVGAEPAVVGAGPARGAVTIPHRLTVDMRNWLFSGREPVLVQKAKARLRALAIFRGCRSGAHVHAYGPVRVAAAGDVFVGSRAFFLAGMMPTELICAAGGRLSIGEDSGFNYGASVEAYERVTIGKRCMIASMVKICDAAGGRATPISLGDDVWVAHGATLLPGAEIGRGSVVSAGSVVGGAIPPDSLVVGNPARAIRLDLLRRTSPRPLAAGAGR